MTLDLARVRNKVLLESDPQIKAFLLYAFSFGALSRSQIFQDAFVQWALKGKREGFFCDFGATDGVFLSNSYALETNFGWTGICAEPATSWHQGLRHNRPGAIVEPRCVWSKSGEQLTFSESASRELSTLTQFEDSDSHSRRRRGAKNYQVETISLNDMLEQHAAPADFDYLSIDTEGSELAILEAFDMQRWRPAVITVEHNYTANRQVIHDLLVNAGYRRVLPEVSLFDDWYVEGRVELPC
ncbi:FkbM family methyltransferase [Hoeflea sp. G2-23]|uniref:FkbM family methyltransferase n=1 Tax=Hoeflea algicola TaxID=2983763 RepID=A0ABT3ZD26_9HYPH|nr:FkbM family methyltransferase [Hoeflea algicola]MCY0149680.1 FkbM family methyltransferase [Hoeflea algicola]